MWDLNSKCPIKVQFLLLPAVVPKPAQKPVQTVTESGVLCYVPVVFKLHFLEPQHSAVMSQRLRVRRRRTGQGGSLADGVGVFYPRSIRAALPSSVW